jgi:pimeloyl-ACP methyl ester carboxylesterase
MPTFTSFDGTSIAYMDEGEGMPVVMIHGFAADANLNFVRPGLLDLVADAGFRAVAADTRGHGLSDKPHDPAAYADDAVCRDVAALVDHLGADECVVMGYSMGAGIALRFASIDLRPRALALLGAGDLMTNGNTSVERRSRMAEAFTADDPDTLEGPARAFWDMADAIRADRLALAALLTAPRPEGPYRLDDVTAPVVIVTGVDDTDVGSPEGLAASLPDVELVRVPGDHFTVNARPETHRAVLAFLEQVAQPS